MKRIFQISLIAAAFLCASSCKDFLGEVSTTTYDMSRLVNSKEALESNIIGCEKQFAGSGFKSGIFCEWLAPASGLLIWSSSSNLSNPLERWTCCHKFTRFSKHPEGYDSFSSFYKAIYRCNSLLATIGGSTVDESYKKEIEGEAYFVRAMSYFYLVRLYGDVTLTTVAPTRIEQLCDPRTNFWEVYCQIVNDLGTAFEKMRSYDRMVAVAGGNSSGRVCNYAAKAERALVYLTIGSLLKHPDDNFWVNRAPDFSSIGITCADDAFRLALADAEDVINNGPFELCPDYRQLFRWTEAEDWQLKERIFVLPRAPESGDAGSGLTQWALPNYYNNTAYVANFGRCRPDRWFFQKWCDICHGTTGKEGEANKNIYVKCDDPRFNVNLIHTSFKGQVTSSNKSGIYNCYPASDRIFPTSNHIMKSYGIPYYKKYHDPTYDNSTGNSDLYLMRFAELYFIAGEAAAWLGDSDKAVKYINVVLKRARQSVDTGEAAEPQDLKAGDYANTEDLVAAIFWQKMLEMPFEHHEYFDTHRYGAKWIVKNISKPKNIFLYQDEQEDYTYKGEAMDGYRSLYFGKTFLYDEDWELVRKGLICGYPNDELVYNSSLDINLHDPNRGQNPVEVFWR